MRNVFLFLVVGLCMIACKKDRGIDTSERLSGVWVEASLRFDTLDFSYMDLVDRTSDRLLVVFRSKPYSDATINPDFPVNHSAWYDYYLDGYKIFMRSSYSSSSFFGDYDFLLQPDQKAFTIKRFYGRNALPETIRFERLP
jgi:hypothetical protein